MLYLNEIAAQHTVAFFDAGSFKYEKIEKEV
jgi:hypothetical protein